jgi:hypothetical protein
MTLPSPRPPIGPKRDPLKILDDRYDLSATIIISQLDVKQWHAHIDDPTLAETDASPTSAKKLAMRSSRLIGPAVARACTAARAAGMRRTTTILIRHSKIRGPTLPLIGAGGHDALVNYLRSVRPMTAAREAFIRRSASLTGFSRGNADSTSFVCEL